MAEEKKSKLAYEKKSAWLLISENEKKKVFEFAEEYKDFINKGKTERECVNYVEKIANEAGFKELSKAKYKAGEKIIIKNSNKNVILAIIGKESMSEGINLIVSHIDAPRLDLKPLPLIEDSEMALLKTHYYGGIKKYHWVNMPLSLHGVIINSKGEKIEITIGEDENDPVFVINDLLPHLSGKIQGEKKASEVIEGENLRLLVGNIPVDDKDIQEKVKETVLRKMNELYGIKEEDFISAELEVVPAFKARDVGIDKSMIGAYGQDDRICSFANFRSLIDFEGIPDKTILSILVDKEEIGSYGLTGIRSKFMYNSIGEIYSLENPDYRESELRTLLTKSYCISADVGAVINPMYKEAFDQINSPKMGCGMLLEKYTGSRGKSGASDASAELMGKLRKIFNDNKVIWQSSLLGKVDEGGGGTVALYLADLGIAVVDSGIGLDGMHSPFEVASKVDLYEAYKGYKAFLKDA
ncbi:MAG: aminopeptidase [Brevinematales bacterium]|nr:aminopeptidase [Brevinematales bacterium]